MNRFPLLWEKLQVAFYFLVSLFKTTPPLSKAEMRRRRRMFDARRLELRAQGRCHRRSHGRPKHRPGRNRGRALAHKGTPTDGQVLPLPEPPSLTSIMRSLRRRQRRKSGPTEATLEVQLNRFSGDWEVLRLEQGQVLSLQASRKRALRAAEKQLREEGGGKILVLDDTGKIIKEKSVVKHTDMPPEVPQAISEEGFEEDPQVVGLWKRQSAGSSIYCVETTVAAYRVVHSRHGWYVDRVIDDRLFVKRTDIEVRGSRKPEELESLQRRLGDVLRGTRPSQHDLASSDGLTGSSTTEGNAPRNRVSMYYAVDSSGTVEPVPCELPSEGEDVLDLGPDERVSLSRIMEGPRVGHCDQDLVRGAICNSASDKVAGLDVVFGLEDDPSALEKIPPLQGRPLPLCGRPSREIHVFPLAISANEVARASHEA
jgi:hypothetical protein